MMTFQAFSEANRTRCEAPDGFNHPIEKWSLSDWSNATFGELGEAANVIKKLNRIRDGIENKETREELLVALEGELADTYIYLDLLAQAAGINLEEAIRRTWNEKSDERKLPHRIDWDGNPYRHESPRPLEPNELPF